MAADAGENRKRELKAFDDTKSGVKGLVDSGIKNVPRIFINSQKLTPEVPNPAVENLDYGIPVIDLQGISQGGEVSRASVVDQIREACKTWGFFQVINHGIPDSTLDETLEAVRRFHEQETEVKKEYYTRGPGKKVMYTSNYTLFSSAVADWRDTFACFMAPYPPEHEELPQVCRDALFDYSDKVMKLGATILELMSMALGLDQNHLKDIGCGEGLVFLGQYYPQCPQPQLTLGASNHTDTDFLTILLQDQVSGLQVLHKDKWFDVPPIDGALVVNLGDLMQLITNDRFKSVSHRVLARDTGPRVSIACFLRPNNGSRNFCRLFGPMRELLSEGEAPIYKELTIQEFDAHHFSKGLNGVSAIEHFKHV